MPRPKKEVKKAKIVYRDGDTYIRCIVCNKLRKVSTQNASQVKRCIEHEYQHRRKYNTAYKKNKYGKGTKRRKTK